MNETKEQILKAALRLFLHSGYSSVTMKDILAVAGLSKGAFYHYFTSKEECFEECILYILGLIGKVKYYMEGSLKDFIDANHQNILLLEYGTALEIMIFMGEAVKQLPKFRDVSNSFKHAELKVWTRMVQNALDSGEIKCADMPAEEIANLFISAGNGTMLCNIFSDGKEIDKQVKLVHNQLYNIFSK